VQVQRWPGYHSPAFTMSVYVHLLDGDLGAPLTLDSDVDAALDEVQSDLLHAVAV
jgi:hypothetical protein